MKLQNINKTYPNLSKDYERLFELLNNDFEVVGFIRIDEVYELVQIKQDKKHGWYNFGNNSYNNENNEITKEKFIELICKKNDVMFFEESLSYKKGEKMMQNRVVISLQAILLSHIQYKEIDKEIILNLLNTIQKSCSFIDNNPL